MPAKRKENAMKKANRDTEGSLEWLKASGRSSEPRIHRLSWGRLARIYYSKKATPAIRRLIEREARRCGYRPSTILLLNRWD